MYENLKQAEQNRKNRVYVGIDPDRDKSGFAIYFRRDKSLVLKNLTFFEIMGELKRLSTPELCGYSTEDYPAPLKVFIEAGWLNKSHWHTREWDNKSVASRIAACTGANHETGKKIVEMCEYMNISYTLIRPTQSKTTQEYFKTLTKYPKRTNSEQRDAAMLVWGR